MTSEYMLTQLISRAHSTRSTTIMRECGIHVVDSPAEIGETMLRVLSGK